ncbi:hypothetical protein ACFQU2_07075 [Siccirubricoccus deserti]
MVARRGADRGEGAAAGSFFAQIQRDDTSVYLLGWGVPTLDALYSFQSLLATRNGAQGDGIWNTAAIPTRGWMR